MNTTSTSSSLREWSTYRSLMSRLADGTVDLVNRIPSFLLIFGVIMLFYFRFKLNFNEEHYMAMAKQFLDENWVKNSNTLTDYGATRLFFQYIVGFFLQYFSFEFVAGFGKLLSGALLAWTFWKLYRLLALTNIDIILHLPILYFFNHSFLGGEFMFLSLEPKALSYPFIILAVVAMLKEKYGQVVWLSTIATYFHILIGGWFMVYFCLYHLLLTRSLKKTIVLGLIYSATLVPLLYFLTPTLSATFNPALESFNADWVYSYYKLPHHAGIFLSLDSFIKNHLDGALVAAAFFVITFFLFSQVALPLSRKLSLFNLLMFAGTFVWLIVAYLDENGSLVKYFPFRISALNCFLVTLQGIYLLRNWYLNDFFSRYIQFGVFSWFALTMSLHAAYGLALDSYRFFSGKINQTPFDEMAAYIRDNTGEEDIFFLMSKSSLSIDFTTFEIETAEYIDFDLDVSFIRKAERDCFAPFFFGPISPDPHQLYLWHQQVQTKIEVLKNYPSLCEKREENRIDYLLTDFPVPDTSCIRLSRENGAYFLYKLGEPGSVSGIGSQE